ncbi:MAG: hypothetical protein J6K20_03440 [Thermoguttaceae bacterium]|nr:hypothetical protein [Thermoguttaceae bacterium]
METLQNNSLNNLACRLFEGDDEEVRANWRLFYVEFYQFLIFVAAANGYFNEEKLKAVEQALGVSGRQDELYEAKQNVKRWRRGCVDQMGVVSFKRAACVDNENYRAGNDGEALSRRLYSEYIGAARSLIGERFREGKFLESARCLAALNRVSETLTRELKNVELKREIRELYAEAESKWKKVKQWERGIVVGMESFDDWRDDLDLPNEDFGFEERDESPSLFDEDFGEWKGLDGPADREEAGRERWEEEVETAVRKDLACLKETLEKPTESRLSPNGEADVASKPEERFLEASERGDEALGVSGKRRKRRLCERWAAVWKRWK